LTTRIVCLGDSITRGVRPGVAGEQTFEAALTSLLAQDGIDVEITNAGIGGETTAGGLARFAHDVLAAHPDYVTVMYGANDSAVNEGAASPRLSLPDYERNLRAMLTRARDGGITPVLMTPIPLGDHWLYTAWSPYKERGANCMIEPYVEVVRSIAADDSVTLIDHFTAWREWERQTGSTIESLQTDSCHPNPAGHELIALTIRRSLHL